MAKLKLRKIKARTITVNDSRGFDSSHTPQPPQQPAPVEGSTRVWWSGSEDDYSDIDMPGSFSPSEDFTVDGHLLSEAVRIEIGGGVTEIGVEAFKNSLSLTNVYIPSNVQSLEDGAFLGCENLKRVDIDSIEWWCNLPFNENMVHPFTEPFSLYINGEKITNLVIPETVNSQQIRTFMNCEGIESAMVPGNIVDMDSMFRNCTNLHTVTLGNGVSEIGMEMFRDCTGLRHVSIPDSVVKIEQQAFQNCISLTSMTFPNNLVAINESSFQNCAELTELTIPSSVEFIESLAFNGCVGLRSIMFRGKTLQQVKDIYTDGETMNKRYPWGVDESVIHAELDEPPSVETITVEFDLNGGIDGNGNSTISPMSVPVNQLIIDILPNIHRSGYSLEGWYANIDGYRKIQNGDRATSNIILRAEWI